MSWPGPRRAGTVFCLRETDGGEMAALYHDSFEHVWISAAPISAEGR